MKRGRLLIVALAAALLASACAPVATFVRDTIDTSDGATLAYVQASAETLSGVLFDPAGEVALGVILVARGTELELLAYPDGATCAASSTLIDCRLGDLSEPTAVSLAGRGVIASATYRREGANTVRQIFAR